MARIDLDHEHVILDDSLFAFLCLQHMPGVKKLLTFLREPQVYVHPFTVYSVQDLAIRRLHSIPKRERLMTPSGFRTHLEVFLEELDAETPNPILYTDHEDTLAHVLRHAECCGDTVPASRLIPVACANAHRAGGQETLVGTIRPGSYDYAMPKYFDRHRIVDCSQAFTIPAP